MKKIAIVTITNLYDPAKSMKVANFSDENVKEAIGKLLEIKPKDLQCEASSMGGGIYSIKKHYRGLKQELKPVSDSLKEDLLIQVSYGDLYE